MILIKIPVDKNNPLRVMILLKIPLDKNNPLLETVCLLNPLSGALGLCADLHPLTGLPGNSLKDQWLGCWAFTAMAPDSISGRKTDPRSCQKIK